MRVCARTVHSINSLAYIFLNWNMLECAPNAPEEADDRQCDEKCIMHNKYDKNYLMFSALCTCFFFAIALSLSPSIICSADGYRRTCIHTHRARITDRHPSTEITCSFCSFSHKYFIFLFFLCLLLLCSLFRCFVSALIFELLHITWYMNHVHLSMHALTPSGIITYIFRTSTGQLLERTI